MTSVPPAIGRWPSATRRSASVQRAGADTVAGRETPFDRPRRRDRCRKPASRRTTAPHAGPGAGQVPPSERPGGRDRLDDLRVAGAAAEVPGDRLADRSPRSAPVPEARKARAAISIPGVQIPHCAAPASRKAACSPSSDPEPAASPSTVRTSRPSTWQTGTRQLFDDLAVDEDRAGPALALPAALLRPGQAEVVAEDVQQTAAARCDEPRPPRR